MRELTLGCGGLLREGDAFCAVGEDGLAELHSGAIILAPESVFEKPRVYVAGVTYRPDEVHLTREQAVAAAIKRREEDCKIRREQIAKDEAALKAMHRQRDEMREWKGQWAGTGT